MNNPEDGSVEHEQVPGLSLSLAFRKVSEDQGASDQQEGGQDQLGGVRGSEASSLFDEGWLEVLIPHR